MSMTVAEARQQIKQNFSKANEIEARYPISDTYPEGLTEEANAADLAEVKRLLSEVDTLEEKLLTLESVEQRRNRIQEGLDRASKPAAAMARLSQQGADREGEQRAEAKLSPGDQFIRDRGYRALREQGAFSSQLQRNDFAVQMKDGTSLFLWRHAAKALAQAEEKALLYAGSSSVGGAFVANDLRSGAIDILQREITVLDLITRLQTDSDTIEYVREDTFTNAAAMTAEASATTGTSGTKPESTLAYSAQTSAVRTLAHWIPVTNRMLADAPAIRGLINSRLLLGLTLALETQILTGDGTGENLTGVLNAGIQTRGVGSDNVMDAIFRARTNVRVTGHARPNAVVVHPVDFEAIRLSRENAATGTLGAYLYGPPSQLGPTTVWGMPVVESEAETENTILVGAFDIGSALFDREQANIRVGLINDQFTRNMQTILAELRAAFVVWRPTAFCRVTGA